MDKIYCITNKVNNKKYIGYTSMTIAERMGQHRHKSNYECKQPIHKAIKKYGWNNFQVSILYEGGDALIKEDKFIKELGDYNISNGGSANQKGRTWNWSEESKIKAKGKIGVKKGNIPWNKGKKGLQVSWCKGKELKCLKELTYSGIYMRDYRKGILRRKNEII